MAGPALHAGIPPPTNAAANLATLPADSVRFFKVSPLSGADTFFMEDRVPLAFIPTLNSYASKIP